MFLSHYREQFLACNYFTLETTWLKTLYVLLLIELDTRRVPRPEGIRQLHDSPDLCLGPQQARQFTWKLQDEQDERKPPLANEEEVFRLFYRYYRPSAMRMAS